MRATYCIRRTQNSVAPFTVGLEISQLQLEADTDLEVLFLSSFVLYSFLLWTCTELTSMQITPSQLQTCRAALSVQTFSSRRPTRPLCRTGHALLSLNHRRSEGTADENDNLNGLLLVGDIHGNLTALRTALELLERMLSVKNGRGKVVFLGDYMDRGKTSVEMRQLLNTLADPTSCVVTTRPTFCCTGASPKSCMNGSLLASPSV